ncbi:MAG: YkgJ family cysteine cluster protein, partial [Parvularculaceae bacterium]|nr:YkgJ family cysteine cluster protein [Parvularculaceae bacterium]
MKCPAYCCSYQHIPVEKGDIKRLAQHFNMTPEEARKKFTKKGDDENPRVLRHKADEHYGTACRFLDS